MPVLAGSGADVRVVGIIWQTKARRRTDAGARIDAVHPFLFVDVDSRFSCITGVVITGAIATCDG
jgi:hypothetical protein